MTRYVSKFDQFDRDFARAERWAVVAFIVNAVLSLALISAVVFVAYKALVHFGIL